MPQNNRKILSAAAVLFAAATVAIFSQAVCHARGFRLYRGEGASSTAETLHHTNTTVYYVDSEETTAADNDADNAVDGDSDTIWQTQWYSENIVTNGALETNTSGWSFYSNGVAALSTVTPGQGGSARAAKITITTAGTNVQFYQYNITLPAATEYQLSFYAYSSTGHDLKVNLLKHVSPYTNYGLASSAFNLTTEWQQFTTTFTTDGFAGTATDARLQFYLADYDANGDIYYIDNIVLTATAGGSNSQPHEIQLDLEESRNVVGLKYLPRQDGVANGRIAGYEIYVSDDPESWGTAVASGTWANDATEKTVTFTETAGRYLRLRSTSEVNGNPWASAAEIGVLVDTSITADLSGSSLVLHYVDSEETTAADNDADNAIDGDNNTIWQTQWHIDSVVSNGAFETNSAGWSFYTNGAGSLSTVTPGQGGSARTARVSITTAGTNVQFYQYNITLQAATEYQLSFYAYSSTGHDLKVNLLKHVSPYTNYGLASSAFNLTTGWQQFTATFTTAGFAGTATDARLQFYLADYDANGDIYYIDNVVLAPTGGASVAQPHEIQLDLSSRRYVTGLTYVPRQDDLSTGMIADYEIYVSDDPESWGTAVASGTWAEDTDEKIITFAAVPGRYLRLRSTSEVDGNPWTSAAELRVTVASSVQPIYTYGADYAVAVAGPNATSVEYTHTESTGTYCFVATAHGYNTTTAAVSESDPSNEACSDMENGETYTLEWDAYTWASDIATAVVAVIDTPQENMEIDLAVSDDLVLEATVHSGVPPYTYAWVFELGLFADYNAGTTYDTGDTVAYGGNTWRALQDDFSSQTPAENSYWTQINDVEDPCPTAAPCKIVQAGDYSVSFNAEDSAEQTDATAEIRFIVVRSEPDNPIDRSDWVICYVDSEELEQASDPAANLLDGDISTLWHTRWDGAAVVPHEVCIDLDASGDTEDYAIEKVKFTPRQTGTNGNPAAWELYLLADDECGDDGDCSDCAWGTAVATGTWANDKLIKEINLSPAVTARYLRLVVTASYGATIDTWASGAELLAYGTPTASVPRLQRLDVTDANGTPVQANKPVVLSHGDYIHVAAVFSEPVDASNSPSLTADLTSENVTLLPADPQPDGHGNGAKKILYRSEDPISRAKAHETARLTVTAITGTYTASDDGVTTTATTPPALPAASNVQHAYQVQVDTTVWKYPLSLYDTVADAVAGMGVLYTTDRFYQSVDIEETGAVDLSEFDGEEDDYYSYRFFGKSWSVLLGAAFGDYWQLYYGTVSGPVALGDYNKIYGMTFADAFQLGNNCEYIGGSAAGGGSTGSDCTFDRVRH